MQLIDSPREVRLPAVYPSPVAEPTVAVTRRNEILVTANWLAAFSKDGGATFSSLRPQTRFPRTESGQRFCCDQVAIYDDRRDLLIWLLQYSTEAASGATQSNIHRIAVAKGSDIADGKWRYYDLAPGALGNWQGEWFDFPDLSVSDDYLYLTSNVFDLSDNFTRSIIMRLPLDKLAAYAEMTSDLLSPPADDEAWRAGSLRPAQGFDNATAGSTDTMFWGAIRNEASVRVFWWSESEKTIHCKDIGVERWSDAVREAPGPRPGAGQRRRDWLGRTDRRITAAWHTPDVVGFAWTGAQSVNPRYPYPQVRVLILDKASLQLATPRVWQPHIWHGKYAFAYPAAAPNRRGEIGISLAFGGAEHHPSHAVGILRREGQGGTIAWKWDLRRSADGVVGPLENVWGDYLTVRPREDGTWMTIGTTAKGDTIEGRQLTDMGLHLVQFGVRQVPAMVAMSTRASDKDKQPKAVATAADAVVAGYLQASKDTAELRRRLDGLKREISGAGAPAPSAAPPKKGQPKPVQSDDERARQERDLRRTQLPVPLSSPRPMSEEAYRASLSRLSQQVQVLDRLLARPTRDETAEKAALAAIEAEAARLRSARGAP